METEAIIPTWLDNNFIATVLQDGDMSKQIKVLSFSAKPAVTAGNNYCSILFRINVEFEQNGELTQTSLIVKTPLADGIGKDLVDELGLVEKECLIYKELLPIMNTVWDNKIIPKNYVCEIPGTIILEDLKKEGYVMCDRLEQLDFDHCNNFMKVISTFHALSLHIHKQEPELIEKVGEEVFFHIVPKPESVTHFRGGLESFANIIVEWKGFEHYQKFIKDNLNTLWDRTVSVCNGKKHIKVLNHGDAWTNNMLFKYDETGKVIDVKLIDLQLCRFASPAIDILIFIMTSAQEDVKLHRLQELYTTYLDSFNSTLKIVGSEERLTLEELQDELKFVEVLQLGLIPGYLAMVLSERDNVMDMEKALKTFKHSDEDEKNDLWKTLNGKHFKKVAKYTLLTLEEQGFLKSI